MLQCVLNGGGRNFIEFYSVLAVLIQPEYRLQMPTYSFALAVGVGCKIDFAALLCFGFQPLYNLFFGSGNFILGLKVIRYLDAIVAMGKNRKFTAETYELIVAI